MSYFCFENIRVVDMTDTRTVNDRIINVVWKGLMGLMRMEKYASRALLLLMAGLILAGCSRVNDGKAQRLYEFNKARKENIEIYLEWFE